MKQIGKSATTNDMVRQAFARRERAHAANLVSDGERLLSYGWYELARWFGDTVWIRTGKLYSQTTASKHMSGLAVALSLRQVRYILSPVESDKEDDNMKLPDIWRDYAMSEGSDSYYVLEFVYSEAQGDIISGVVEQSLTLEQAQWLIDNPQAIQAPAPYEIKMRLLNGDYRKGENDIT